MTKQNKRRIHSAKISVVGADEIRPQISGSRKIRRVRLLPDRRFRHTSRRALRVDKIRRARLLPSRKNRRAGLLPCRKIGTPVGVPSERTKIR
ncbi:MAG: hypothetical protein RMK89_03465 [Armatimonadota bacterium]|nr:hypothetical protein [Armatimonadota bacterium]MDW8142503.1 hypothetical protein [Armatimonadota bacterium]